MYTKIVRIIAVLAFAISIIGNPGAVQANSALPQELSSKSSEARQTSVPMPQNIPALAVPPVISLGVQFIQVATAANSVGKTTFIDNPLTNGNLLASIFVTANWTPGGVSETVSTYNVGVLYDLGRSQWGVYNENGSPMAAGNTFNIIVLPPSPNVSVQTASTNSNAIVINNLLTDNNPNAIIIVTPIWNPGGGVSGTDANFPVSVLYNDILNKWTIFDQTGAIIPNGTSFNMAVFSASSGLFVHTTNIINTISDSTLIDNPLTNGHPSAIVIVSPHFTTGGLLDANPIGVRYANGSWMIFNRFGGNMPLNTSFNVLVLVPQSDIFVHKATSGNIISNYTIVDNAFTNSNPNGIIFTTPNLNPGGGSGIYNNHNIGVTYNGSAWRIFNQNGSSIPTNSAFNVLVPHPDTSVFVHTATAANINVNQTAIDYPLTNGNPNAILFVTQNFNPGNVGGSSDDHPLGVMYVNGKWWIYNEDGVNMPVGAAFNVTVPSASPDLEVFVHTATAGNSGGNFTIIDNHLSNLNPNAIILVTANFDPNNLCACVDANFPIGVGFVGDVGLGKWAIINQNGPASPIPDGATFNVYVFGNYSKLYLPVIMR